jgi:hypothetical protein
MNSGSRSCGCRLFFVIRETAPRLTTCAVQNLRAKKKRSGTQSDTLIAKTPRTLFDFTPKILSKSARVLIGLFKRVPNLEQSALLDRLVGDELMTTERRTCFVIMPFSKTTDEHTEEHWTKHYEIFLKPLLEENSGIEARRSQPLRGDILNQIISDLIHCPIVVADLTDRNANVFWELGVRQSFKHGTLTVAEEGTTIPFDISTKSTLFYYPNDYVKMATFRQAFKSAIQDCLVNPSSTDSRVLEILGGRGTLFEIFRGDDTVRRLHALESELKYDLRLMDSLIKQSESQATSEAKGYPVITEFRSTALELMVAERYIDVSDKIFDKFERLLSSFLIFSRHISGRVDKLRPFSEGLSMSKTLIEECLLEAVNYREKIRNRP